MLNKLWLAFDLALITAMLIFAISNYWSGDLFFIVDVFVILALSASRIIRWQINKTLRESELLFGERYLQYLEAMGYDNGDGKQEVK